jgi:hypothetical protein
MMMTIRRKGLRVTTKGLRRMVVLPAACFTLSGEDLEQLFMCLVEVKVPHGYSWKISRYLDIAKKRFSGMNSYDCHVLMAQILPIAI